MSTLNDADLENVADSLSSGEYGAFPISNLVNYGSTIVVRPGARTTNGAVLAGIEVARMLPPGYVAFPIMVEYGAEPASELAVELASLHGTVMKCGSGSSNEDFGATAVKKQNIRARYAHATERFRVRIARFHARRVKGRKASLRNAEQLLARLERTWRRMGKIGVDRSGLISPTALRRELLGTRTPPMPRIAPSVPVMRVPTRYPATRPTMRRPWGPSPTIVAPTVQTPVVAPPVAPAPARYTPVSQEYLRDQAALERENQSPSYYGASDHAVGQEDLAADLRAESVGYLFGPIEHDYFGVSNEEDDEVEFTSADFTALVSRAAGGAMVDAMAGIDLDNLPVSSMVDVLGGVLDAERLNGLARMHPGRARLFRRRARRQSNAAHLARIRLEEPVVVDEVEDEEDVVSPEELAEFGLDDEGVDDSEEEVDEADEAEEAEEAPKAPLDASKSKAANLQRRVLLPSVAELRSVAAKGEGSVLDRTERAAKMMTQITDVLRAVAPNGSVNYARLRPASGAHEFSDPVIVIGIQKQTEAPTNDLLDVLTEEEVVEVPRGYDVTDAVNALTQYTSVSDYVGGDVITSRCGGLNLLSALVAPMNWAERVVNGPVLYGAANNEVYGVAPDSWPNGDAAPLPPPRRVGAEVYGA